MNRPPSERRREQRTAAAGRVEIVLRDPLPENIDGELVDISPDGFRVSHKHSGLRPGHEVRFHHPSGEGRARVMWTRILSGRVETGFLVLRPGL